MSILRKIAKGILKLQGYKIVIIRVQNGYTHIDGDKELLKYTDITGFLYNKEPLKRTYPEFIEREPIKPLTPEQLIILREDTNEPLTDKESIHLESLNPHGNSIVSEWDNYNTKEEDNNN